MGKKKYDKLNDDEYEKRLYELWIELVKLQRHVIAADERILLILEGRDAAGKDGTIKRLTEHLSPRDTRIFAPGKPNERERGSWYFQRFVPHFPAAGEIVIFNRSWYNRAGVEAVMGFCTPTETEVFLNEVLRFEGILGRSGIQIRKYYLDIDRDEQAERLEERRKDPLKQWKISPVDARAEELWDEYSAARNLMFERTHDELHPWTVVRADHKKTARVNAIAHFVSGFEYEDKREDVLKVDPRVVFPYGKKRLRDGSIAE